MFVIRTHFDAYSVGGEVRDTLTPPLIQASTDRKVSSNRTESGGVSNVFPNAIPSVPDSLEFVTVAAPGILQ
jgi:hypothetical protein